MLNSSIIRRDALQEKISIFEDKYLCVKFAQMFLEKLKDKSSADLPLIICIGGGNTPKKFLTEIVKQTKKDDDLNLFHQCYFLTSDERYVPEEHEDNNSYLLQKFLINPLGLKQEQIIKFDTTLPIEDCQKDMNKKIATLLESATLYLTILGLGPDCHVASLFPDQMEIINSKNFCEITGLGPDGHQGLSFTPYFLNQSTETTFVISGQSKSLAVKNLLSLKYDPQKYPGQAVIQDKNYHLFLDTQAAKLIK